MVTLTDLKRINFLKEMPDHLLNILAQESQLSIFGTGTQLISDSQDADTFFMLVMGQVAIKQNLTIDIDVIFALVQSGASFGLPALIEGQTSSFTAVCQEPCEVITLSGRRLRELFDQNHELAYYMFKGAANQYKQNIDKRAKMILKVVDENPEMKEKMGPLVGETLAI
jgi:CRP-like cAMP-binding protein